MDTVFITSTRGCHFKGTPVVKPAAATSPICVTACRKLDGVAAWLMNGVAAVFFTTLECCSCIYIDTKDDFDDANNNCLPLIFSGNVHEEVLLQKKGIED